MWKWPKNAHFKFFNSFYLFLGSIDQSAMDEFGLNFKYSKFKLKLIWRAFHLACHQQKPRVESFHSKSCNGYGAKIHVKFECLILFARNILMKIYCSSPGQHVGTIDCNFGFHTETILSIAIHYTLAQIQRSAGATIGPK